MMLVLPHEGVSVYDIESKLRTDVMSEWYRNLQEGWVWFNLSTKYKPVLTSDTS